MPNFDDRDQEIYNQRQEAFLRRTDLTDIRQGDFILFADGTLKRVAHVWDDEQDCPEYIQPTTANGNCGSFYIGYGYASFSGSLDSPIPFSKFKKTNELKRDGWFWFFHHDFAYRDNTVYVFMETPVWECSANYEVHELP